MKALNVFCNMYGRRLEVGRLRDEAGEIVFQYAGDFLRSGLPLSPFKLPLQGGVFRDERRTFDGLYGLFNDSLPDGWGLMLLDRKLRARGLQFSETLPLDRLAMVGTQGMGALEYEPEYEIGEAVSDYLDLDGLAAESRQILNESGTIAAVERLLRLGGSSGGARPKILCGVRPGDWALASAASSADFEAWLIKFCAKDDAENLGALEYAYSIAAKNAGVEMPRAHLFPAKTSAGFFGVKRFDRVGGQKIHVHSACGLLHASHRYPSLGYEDLLKLTQLLTRDQTETEKMARLMVFNVKAKNMDDHAKNFAFLMLPDGAWKMAPAFDITPSAGFNGEHATSVNGKGKNITNADLIAAASTVGISAKNVRGMVADVEAALAAIHKNYPSITSPQAK
jgi:serine/threonine-protein kinase HipA